MVRGPDILAERFGAPFGGLFAGSAADIVVRSSDRVRHVVVAGRIAVRDGALVTGDLDEIRRTAMDEAARLWPRMQELGA